MITIRPLIYMASSPTPPTPPGPSIPSVTIGNQIWSTVYVDPTISGVQSTHTETIHGQTIHYYTYPQLENVTFPDGWRLPILTDVTALKSYFNSDNKSNFNCVISELDGGTDDYNLNLYITGIWDGSSLINTDTSIVTIADAVGTRKYAIGCRLDSNTTRSINVNSYLTSRSVPFRLIKDIT